MYASIDHTVRPLLSMCVPTPALIVVNTLMRPGRRIWHGARLLKCHPPTLNSYGQLSDHRAWLAPLAFATAYLAPEWSYVEWLSVGVQSYVSRGVPRDAESMACRNR